MPNTTVTRQPNGFADATETGIYANVAILRPFRYINMVDDFFRYVSGDWVQTLAASATAKVGSLAGGVLQITNVGAGATDESSIQWAGGSGAFSGQFQFDSTKDQLLYTKVKVDSVANAAFLVGIGTVDTTPLASLIANFIGFYKAAGANILATCRIGGVATSVDCGAMTDDTYVEIALFYDSTLQLWKAYLANALIGSFAQASNTPTGLLAPTIGVLNASTAAHVVSVDWVHFAQYR